VSFVAPTGERIFLPWFDYAHHIDTLSPVEGQRTSFDYAHDVNTLSNVEGQKGAENYSSTDFTDDTDAWGFFERAYFLLPFSEEFPVGSLRRGHMSPKGCATGFWEPYGNSATPLMSKPSRLTFSQIVP
jgi:hypothetical protein